MKNRITHQQEIDLSGDAKTSVYISEYNEAVQITLRDKDARDETHVIEVEIPLHIARHLICELVEDLTDYDQNVADREAEAKAKAEEIQESLRAGITKKGPNSFDKI